MHIKIAPSLCIFICCLGMFMACRSPKEEKAQLPPKTKAPFAQLSQRHSHYQDFDSPKAINAIVEMENQYFEAYEDSVSPFYGTLWREFLEKDGGGEPEFERYRRLVNNQADSMHCTIYAVKALQAGMGEDFEQLERSHRQIWGDREHAGWSLGYLLVRDWGWKAYAIIDTNSSEFAHCKKAYQRRKVYPVWHQPDIPLTAQYIRGEHDSLISALLAEHEFGWGFSDQGYHTWITRFEILKECNWLGAPGMEFSSLSAKPLFLRTSFFDYKDYYSHILIVPPLLPTNL